MNTQTGVGKTIQDILDILTGRKKASASVDTTINIGLDQSSMLYLGLTILLAGTILIFINIGANKLVK